MEQPNLLVALWHDALQPLNLMRRYKLMSTSKKTTHQVAEASGRSDEAEGDGSVAVVDPEDHVQGLALGGMHVRWWVEVQTLLPLVQVGAYLGVRWRAVEAHVEAGDRGDLVVAGRRRVVEVCKVQGEADDPWVEVQEGDDAGHVAQGQASP